MNNILRIALFRVGCHTDSAGGSRCYSREDLDRMAEGVTDPIPHVITHAARYSPFAYATSSKVWREGDTLYADAENPQSDFARLVSDRRLYSRSIRIDHTPNGPRIAHIAWLGAEPPAVEGLPPVDYAHGGVLSSDYRQPDITQVQPVLGDGEVDPAQLGAALAAAEARERALQQRLQQQQLAATRAENARWVDRQVHDRRLTPGEAEGAVEEMVALSSASDYARPDGQRVTPLETYRRRIESRPPVPGAISPGSDPGRGEHGRGAAEYAAPRGYSYDPEDAAMVARAREYSRKNNVSFVEAYQQLQEGM